MLEFLLDRASGGPLRVLCLGAHSDDIEIGCGGTLLRLLEERDDVEVWWVVFSSGAEREREARESAALFLAGAAASHVLVRDFRNGHFPYIGSEIKEFFEELKGQVDPDLIFTHFRADRHQDHRVLSDLAWNTWRNHVILEYEIPKYDGDLSQPNAYVVLDEATCARKVRFLMQVFATQRDKHWFDEMTFRGLMRLRGMESCAPDGYAEAFHLRKIVLAPRRAGVRAPDGALASEASTRHTGA